MAEFFADENFRLEVVEALRGLGHDVLTVSPGKFRDPASTCQGRFAILRHSIRGAPAPVENTKETQR